MMPLMYWLFLMMFIWLGEDPLLTVLPSAVQMLRPRTTYLPLLRTVLSTVAHTPLGLVSELLITTDDASGTVVGTDSEPAGSPSPPAEPYR